MVSLCWLGVVVGDGNSNADSAEAKGSTDGGRAPCKLAALELWLHLACWREGLVDTAWSPSPLPVAGKSCPWLVRGSTRRGDGQCSLYMHPPADRFVCGDRLNCQLAQTQTLLWKKAELETWSAP